MSRNYVRSYVEVSLDEFDDDAILEEAKARRLNGFQAWDGDLERIYDAVCEGRSDDAKLILEKHLRPMWRNLQSCADAFERAKAS